MRRVANYEECNEPGDFFWQVKDTTIEPGKTIYRAPRDGERPTDFWFMTEHEDVLRVTVRPGKQDNGASWGWDGNLDKPTLEPSIKSSFNNSKGNEQIIWHGHIVAGELRPCDDSPKVAKEF